MSQLDISTPEIIWEYNGYKFELDLYDEESSKRYEKAFTLMDEDEKNMPKTGSSSTIIRAYYQMFVNLYDRILGKGSGVKILGEKANARICNIAYADFIEFANKQKQSMTNFGTDIRTKYSSNRAGRNQLPGKYKNRKK